MKSSNEDLRKRGFIFKEDIFNFQHLTNSELFLLINSQVSEVIDAIGFLLFYTPDHVNDNFFKSITDTLDKYSDNNLIVWKCVCCLSSFRTKASIDVLNQIIASNENHIIKSEAQRSLRLISEYKHKEGSH